MFGNLPAVASCGGMADAHCAAEVHSSALGRSLESWHLFFEMADRRATDLSMDLMIIEKRCQ